jgi:putative ABC transport system permease protein
VVGRAAALAAVGVVAGTGGALLLTRAMESLLFGVRPADPATYTAVALLLAGAALLAGWLPARRAAAVDPLEAIRSE